jgi:hypothetical protein
MGFKDALHRAQAHSRCLGEHPGGPVAPRSAHLVGRTGGSRPRPDLAKQARSRNHDTRDECGQTAEQHDFLENTSHHSPALERTREYRHRRPKLGIAIAAGMMAVIHLVAGWQRPRLAVIVSGILWLLYAVYERLVATGVLCDADCNIRVDLVFASTTPYLPTEGVVRRPLSQNKRKRDAPMAREEKTHLVRECR